MPLSPRLRLIAGLASAAMLAAACGGTDGADAGAEASGTRTVVHAMGETEVPADPQRVVVLDSPHLDAALSLGITPVAAVQSSVDEGLPEYLGERTEGIEVVGTILEPDLELIAAAQPDLILSAKVRHEDIHDQLSEIAPTVFTESSGTSFKDGLATIADALGRTDELETQLAAYEQRADEVGEAVGADGMEATIVRFLPGETRLYGPDTFSGTVLTDIGFSLGEKGFDENPYSMAMVSPEQAELAEGDVIFATTYGDPSETTLGEMQPLMEQLDAEVHEVNDREWMLGIGLIGAELVLDDVEALLGGGDATDSGTLSASATDSPDAFPVTVEHVHGETTIEARPERVVVVGIRDQDAVLALGVTPVAVRDWFGDQPDAVWPWAQDELGDADPVVLPAGEIDVEQVATLEPDVIIGVDADLSAEQYALLSEVAPTVAQPAGFTPHAIPWRERTMRVAQALGEVERAEQLIDEVEDTIRSAAEAHPEFAQATALVGLSASDGQAYAYGPDDVRSRFLIDLGFSVPEVITEQVPDDSFFVTLSQERFGDLDADVLLWIGGGVEAFENVTSVATYPQRVAEEGRDLFLPYDPLGGAMSFASVLSLPFLVEELVPELELALDGDTSTSSEFGR